MGITPHSILNIIIILLFYINTTPHGHLTVSKLYQITHVPIEHHYIIQHIIYLTIWRSDHGYGARTVEDRAMFCGRDSDRK